jgi:hypothetical protein
MEVTSTSNSGPLQPRRSSADDRVDITRHNRDGIEEATVDIAEIRAPQEPWGLRHKTRSDETGSETPQRDRIELSDEGRRLLAKESETASAEAERKERVAELERSYREGTLNTRERIDRAAASLLGGA